MKSAVCSANYIVLLTSTDVCSMVKDFLASYCDMLIKVIRNCVTHTSAGTGRIRYAMIRYAMIRLPDRTRLRPAGRQRVRPQIIFM